MRGLFKNPYGFKIFWGIQFAGVCHRFCQLSKKSVVLEDKSEIEMSASVSQGSVLEPILQNIYYNKVLKICMPQRVKLIWHANDLAVVVVARKKNLRKKANKSVERVKNSMLKN